MYRFIFYIVFLFFCFNFEAVKASDLTKNNVVFAPLKDEQKPKTLTLPEASNLPHPIQMREMMEDKNATFSGKLLMLARYFDARYPADLIEADFTDDLVLIFPNEEPEEIKKIDTYLRAGIKIYRLINEKVTEIKAAALLPKDPPLTAPDDAYAIIGDQDYIKAPAGQFAIVSDFKKIIGYSHNLREKEAMDAFLKRQFKNDKADTDFEHFTDMLQKIEWDKFFLYGTSLPSPFVGNAGIGTFTRENDYKIRLLSEEARIGDNSEILGALHVIVPSHRFMLASSLDNTRLKPKITLTNLQNIESYEVFYPLPRTAVSEKMIGAYRGDFAFPIKLKISDLNKPITMEAELSFENCDANLDCRHENIKTHLNVGVDQRHQSVFSSIQNFVRQSYYNLPLGHNKHIELKNVSYAQIDEKTYLNFDFSYSAKIKNFTFLLENEQNSVFADPEMVTADGHIYLRTYVLENEQNIQNTPLTISVRLNDYDTLRQTIILDQYQKQKATSSFLKVFMLGLWIGFGFYLSFFGLPLLMELFLQCRNKAYLKRYTLSKGITSFCVLATLFFYSIKKPDIFYFEPTTHTLYLFIMLFILISKWMALSVRISKDYLKPFFYGLISALLLFFAFSLTPTIGFASFIQNIQSSFWVSFLGYIGFWVGLMLPDILSFLLSNKEISSKLKFSATVLFQIFLLTDIIILLLWILLPLTFFSIIKILFLTFLAVFVLRFLFYFWQALYHTDLPKSYISGTQSVLALLLLIFIFSAGRFLCSFETHRLEKSQNVSFEELREQASNGENILLALYAPNCLKCIYNNLTVFNPYMLERLKQGYQVSYIPVISKNLSDDALHLLEQYKRYQRPLYILLTPLTPNGVALNEIIFPADLFSTLESFHLEVSSSEE